MNAQIIAKWVNVIITLIIPAVFLKLYFTSTAACFYKKKWVIVVGTVLILCAIVQIIDAIFGTYLK